MGKRPQPPPPPENPLKAQGFDPTPRRESTRTIITLVTVIAYVAVVVMAATSAICLGALRPPNSGLGPFLKELYTYLGPVLFACLGFYFGAENAAALGRRKESPS